MIQICTPAGSLNIRCGKGGVESVEFAETQLPPADFSAAEQECARQLEEYFTRKRKVFTLPMALKGSPFELAVWNKLLEIPYGQTLSYGAVAAELGKSGAARAVGMACRRNPVAVLVPCHRVVSASGKLTGYAYGIGRKRILLDLESNDSCAFSEFNSLT